MRLNIDDALVIIVATAVLHNVCIKTILPEPIPYEEFIQPDELYNGYQPNNTQAITRNAIIENYFN